MCVLSGCLCSMIDALQKFCFNKHGFVCPPCTSAHQLYYKSMWVPEYFSSRLFLCHELARAAIFFFLQAVEHLDFYRHFCPQKYLTLRLSNDLNSFQSTKFIIYKSLQMIIKISFKSVLPSHIYQIVPLLLPIFFFFKLFDLVIFFFF